MPELRRLLADAGLAEVQTYPQNGNGVLSSDGSPELGSEAEPDPDAVSRIAAVAAESEWRVAVGRELYGAHGEG
jgi:uncharacterized protein (DUF1697 family)